jgi:hypothetical protein
MYEGTKGAGVVLGSSIVLPNTGGNSLLQFVATAGIVIGGAIILSSVVRTIAAKAFKA